MAIRVYAHGHTRIRVLEFAYFAYVLVRLFSSGTVEDNTWAYIDMEYVFKCSTLYLTSERSEQVRYKVKHEKRYSISTSSHVLFCLLYTHPLNDVFVDLNSPPPPLPLWTPVSRNDRQVQM